MSILGFFTVLFLIVCAVILAEMYREQHSFCVTHYEVHSPKITCTAEKDPVNRIIFLSDMHNHVYGKQNNKLFEAIRAEQPDLILIGGDMLVAKNDVRYQEALDFVSRLPQLCPVYYASGNHEQRIKENQENYSLCYEEYRKKLQAEGVHFLENESCDILLGNQPIHISGLELPLIVNKKFRKADVTAEMYADAWEKSILQEIRKNSRRQQRILQTTVITFCLPTIHPIWKLIRNGVPI